MATTEPNIVQLPSTPEDSAAKASRGPSCVLCQQRKVKCNRQDPCSACIRSQLECTFRAPAPPQRRKRRLPESDLLERLKRYEDLLKSLGVKIDHSDDGNAEISPNRSGPRVPALEPMVVDSRHVFPHADRNIRNTKSPAPQARKLLVRERESRCLEKYVVPIFCIRECLVYEPEKSYSGKLKSRGLNHPFRKVPGSKSFSFLSLLISRSTYVGTLKTNFRICLTMINSMQRVITLPSFYLPTVDVSFLVPALQLQAYVPLIPSQYTYFGFGRPF